MKNIIIYGFLLFFLILLHSTSVIIAAPPLATAEEFEYIEGSPKGPSKWGELKAEWALCKTGMMQSPIDLLNQTITEIPQPNTVKQDNYMPCNTTKIKNLGHIIQVEWIGDAGSIQIDGTNYLLRSGHWHIPSEHAINGKRFDMELHVVHQCTDPNMQNQRAVVGILFQIGEPDPLLSKLTASISSLVKKHEEKRYGEIDPKEILGDCKSFYRYMGSLTTPPCTEGVIWTVNKKVRTVSADQIRLLQDAVDDSEKMNARPLQPDNRREVRLYDAGN